MKTEADQRRALMSRKILTLGTGRAWLEEMARRGIDFHLEDDPAEVMSTRTGQLTFSEEEWPLLRERVRELYALDWSAAGVECPIGYLLKVREEMEQVR